MLMGEFHHNLDDKNRLIIPSKFRYELGSKFIVTRGIEKCLFVYPVDEWNKIIEKLSSCIKILLDCLQNNNIYLF